MPNKSKLTAIKNIYGSESHKQVFTEISYIKKRIHLIEGERKANYESNEEQLKVNEQIIHGIRQQNIQLKKENKEISKLSGDYFQDILTRLKGVQQIAIFRGKNFEETADILECKIGDLKNKLNLLKFDKKQTILEKKLVIKTEKEVQILLSAKPQSKHDRLQRLKETENAISTMQLRITEAENVRSRYKYMIDTLEAENFTKNVQINEMETKIQKQLKEKSTTRAILSDAVKARKASRVKLAEVEDITMRDYGLREQKLLLCRANLKAIRDKMEHIGTKLTYPKFHMIHRDSSLTEGLYLTVTGPSENQEIKQNVMEKVYKDLKDVTGESDPVLIIARFQQQRQHSKDLELKEKEVRSQARKSRLRKRFLQDKLNNLQFCGGIQWQDLDEHHTKIHAEIEDISNQIAEAKELINDYSSILELASAKLFEMHLQNGLRAPATSSPTSDNPSASTDIMEKVLDMLKFIITTVEHAFEEQEIFTGSSMQFGGSENELSEASVIIGLPDLKHGSIVDLNLSNSGSLGRMSNLGHMPEGDIGVLSGKVRGKGKTLDKKSDSSDDEEAVTRIVVKRQSQVLVESKTRKGRFNATMSSRPR